MRLRFAVKLVLVALPLLLLVIGASSQAPAPPAAPKNGSVTHVVVCWLKNPKDLAARKQLIEATHGFKSIPGVVSVSTGQVLPTTRPHSDSSFDVGIVINFNDAEALQAYIKDPIHQKAVKEVLAPLAKDWKTFDFTNE